MGSFNRFHTDTRTDTTITGLWTACKSTFPTACQLVMSSQLKPRHASMGRKMDAARLNQNTGFLNRTFQLIFILVPPYTGSPNLIKIYPTQAVITKRRILSTILSQRFPDFSLNSAMDKRALLISACMSLSLSRILLYCSSRFASDFSRAVILV